jgi:hypothetical protein
VVVGTFVTRNLAYAATYALYNDPNWNTSSEMNSYLISGVVLMFIGYYLLDRVESLFPVVELESGPKHLQREDRTRRLLVRLVMYIVVPLVLSILAAILV